MGKMRRRRESRNTEKHRVQDPMASGPPPGAYGTQLDEATQSKAVLGVEMSG